jgi:hypothetical protein
VRPQSILALALLLTPVVPASPATSPSESPKIPSLLYTVAKTYEPLAWVKGADRFSADAAIYIRDENGSRPLIRDFTTSADPAISFDGKTVLFAGKVHSQDHWQIWELNLEEGKPRRLTSGSDDCIRPFYLPEDRIIYACKFAGRFVIESLEVENGKVLPLTYISSNSLPTDVLHDGRILFESSYPLGTQGVPELYMVYSDGSGIESYRCDHGSARHSARQSGSGDIVFTTARGLARFTSARAQEVSIAAPAGEYAGDVIESVPGDWLLSWRPNADAPFRLMRWTPGAKQLESVIAEANASIIQSTLLVQRVIPNRHPSGLHDWANANLLCLNAYTSKYQFAPGSISSVRMYARDATGTPKLLGTAPVERDGSFFVQVPTEQPLQIELVDTAGKTLKRESGFFWMRRGEQRGCVGCHAGPETAPENAVPMTLLKSTTPADMTGASVQSAGGH